jgi:hypothetical protein
VSYFLSRAFSKHMTHPLSVVIEMFWSP